MKAFLALMQERNKGGNTSLHIAFSYGHINVIETVYKLVGRDAFLALMQERNLFGDTPLHDAFTDGQIEVIETVYKLVGRDTFLALMKERDKYNNTRLDLAALWSCNAVFVWLLERCKEDTVFKQKLKALVQSLEEQLESYDPAIQAAIRTLLEFLNSDPDEGCNLEEYSSLDDDDGHGGGGSGGSNGKNESKGSVILVDCSHLFNTQTGSGNTGSNNQSKGGSSKKAAYSLMDSFKLNPSEVEGGAEIRSALCALSS